MKKIALVVVMLIGIVSTRYILSEHANEMYAILSRLIQGNAEYVNQNHNPADISQQKREFTATHGQEPYAVIVTCSDSRVPPEHIFSAGLGELFVIRTAGNVVGEFELGSIEYGVEHLGAKLIVVLGHTGCGAVVASLSDSHITGNIQHIINEIKPQLKDVNDVSLAENRNITHSYDKILQSDIISDMLKHNEIEIVKAKYNIYTGVVEFLE